MGRRAAALLDGPASRLGASLIISELLAGGLVAWVGLTRKRELAAHAAGAHVSPAAVLTAGGVTLMLLFLAAAWPAVNALARRRRLTTGQATGRAEGTGGG